METRPGNRLAQMLALNRSVAIVLLSVLFFGLGENLWAPFMPMFLDARAKEFTNSAVIGEAIPWAVLGMVGAYACLRNLLEGFCYVGGGQLTAWLGDRGSIIFFGALTAFGYALFLVVPLPWVAIFAAILILGWEPLSVPVTFTTVGATLQPSRRGMAFALQSIQKRLPKVIGPAVAGFVIDAVARNRGDAAEGYTVGMQYLVALSFGLALVSLVMQVCWMPKHPLPPPGPPLWEIPRAFPPTLRRLLMAEILTRWCDWLVREFVVLYLAVVRGVPARDIGLLFALQNLVALITYLPVGQMTKKAGLQPFIGVTFIFFALFPLTLSVTPSAWLAVPFIVNGLREIGEPARKALITSLLPEAVRARAIGMYWGLRAFAICWSSLVGAGIWLWLGPEWLFYVAFALGVAGAGVFYLRVRGSEVEAVPAPVPS